MAATPTIVEILNSSLSVVAQVKSLYPLDKSGTVLQYSKELSDFGQCRFRVSAFDQMLTTYGDILVPHRYHVRIRKGAYIVWQGAIIGNPKRNKDFIEIIAVEYEFYLGKLLINRTSSDVNGTSNIYRTFSSGTMGAAITALMNETITAYTGTAHVLKNLTLGTVENPNYPPGMVDGANPPIPLTGAWSFGLGGAGQGPTLQYDFHTVLYVLKSMGVYSYADFQIVQNPSSSTGLVFNFKKFLGNNRMTNLIFTYGPQGNIVNYNLPRLGQRQVNDLTAIATDPNGVILHQPARDEASIAAVGPLQGVAAYSDVKSQAILDTRATAEIPLISSADETNVTVMLNETGYPLGQYDIGDIITIRVVNKGVSLNQVRRIVGITVLLNGTGREMISLQTNIPQAWQYQGV